MKNSQHIEKTYNEWKLWIKEHNCTPRFHSKDFNERSLAQRFKNCIYNIRKQPGEYDYMLKEYDEMLMKYSKSYVIRNSSAETFEMWKNWCLEHQRLPYSNSDDETERYLARKIGLCMPGIRQKPEVYAKQIKSYEEINALYNSRKTPEERIKEWKDWVIKNERLPRRAGKFVDIEEKHMAGNILRIYKMMLTKPEKYFKCIVEYETIRDKYMNPDIKLEPLHVFNEWKNWVIKNEMLPSCASDNKEEVIIAKRMANMINVMKQDEIYSKEIKEYNELREKFKGKREIIKYKNKFYNYKAQIEKQNYFPSFSVKKNEEKRFAERIWKLIKILETNPEIYSQELNEWKALREKYLCYEKMDIVLINFNIVKNWIEENQRFPNSYKKGKEGSIYTRLRRTLKEIHQNPVKYNVQLQEYEGLLELYSKDKKKEQLFNLWKDWTVKNGVIPSTSSSDQFEKELAIRVRYMLESFKKSYNKHEQIIQEYDFMRKEYSRAKYTIQKNIAIFEEWKDFCLSHRRLPTCATNDQYEYTLYNKGKYCIKCMRKDSKHYMVQLKQVLHIYSLYKNK